MSGPVVCGTCGRFAASMEKLDGHDCRPSAPEFPVITEAVKLTLKPGDILALKVDAKLRAEQLAHVKDWFSEQLPPGIHVVVLDRNLSLQVVERASEEGTP